MLRSAWMIGSVAVFALGGCGGGGTARSPDEVLAAYQGPIQSSDVARGEEVFNNVCNSCHAGGAPALQGIGWEAGRVRQQVREGGGRMPAIAASRVSDEDLEALLAYMTTIDAVTGELPTGAAPAEPTEGEGEPAEGEGEAAGEDG
jgi:mono/diheme cytochrome c family protein